MRAAAMAGLLCAASLLAPAAFGATGKRKAATSKAKPALAIGLASDWFGAADPTVGPNVLSYGYWLTPNHTNPVKFLPGLATLTRDQGNQTYTFTLRHDVHFSDGTLMTAQTEALWWNTIKNTKTLASINQALGGGVIASVTTRGKWILVIHLKGPAEAFPYPEYLDFPPRAVMPACAKNLKLLATTNCGAGPYYVDFAATTLADHIVYTPNPNYYDKSAQRWSKITLLNISNPSSMVNALRAGQIQVAEGDPTTAAAAARDGFKVVTTARYNTGVFLDFTATPALKSLQVRQALNYAIDRKTLAKAFNVVPEQELLTSDGIDPNPKYANYYSYNPTKAKSLLTAAGYPNGFTMKVYTAPGLGQLGTPLIEAMASQLGKVGVKINITPCLPGNACNDATYQCTCGSGPMAEYYGLFMNNVLGWHDPSIDNLYKKGLVATGAPQRAYWRQITDRVVSQAYDLPLLVGYVYWYINPRDVVPSSLMINPQNWQLRYSDLVPK
jgi:peptide/nickel transport system substrate-binding protein